MAGDHRAACERRRASVPEQRNLSVSSYGSMEVRFDQPPEMVAFAEATLRDYQELDEVGRVANKWALQLAQIAQELVGRRESGR